MKTMIYLNDKKVSRKAMNEMIGKELMDKFMKQAKEGFMNDPLDLQSWFLGRNKILVIEFK
jgi:hypothetical protein